MQHQNENTPPRTAAFFRALEGVRNPQLPDRAESWGCLLEYAQHGTPALMARARAALHDACGMTFGPAPPCAMDAETMGECIAAHLDCGACEHNPGCKIVRLT